MKATIILFILCVVTTVFCWMQPQYAGFLSFSGDDFAQGEYWTVISTLFVHGSLLHLGGNMLALLVFGIPLERIIGSAKLYLAYFLGGALGVLAGKMYYPPNEFVIGASGAICTLIAILILFNPWRVSFILTLLPMPLGAAGVFYMLLNVFLAEKSHHNPGDNPTKVAYDLHVIGFVIGIIFGALWSPKWKTNLLISIGLCIITFLFYFFIFRLLQTS